MKDHGFGRTRSFRVSHGLEIVDANIEAACSDDADFFAIAAVFQAFL
jgi:hypothetical protein